VTSGGECWGFDHRQQIRHPEGAWMGTAITAGDHWEHVTPCSLALLHIVIMGDSAGITS
jgi:hypothetical protein